MFLVGIFSFPTTQAEKEHKEKVFQTRILETYLSKFDMMHDIMDIYTGVL